MRRREAAVSSSRRRPPESAGRLDTAGTEFAGVPVLTGPGRIGKIRIALLVGRVEHLRKTGQRARSASIVEGRDFCAMARVWRTFTTEEWKEQARVSCQTFDSRLGLRLGVD
jgi:hypothetical protein